VTGPQLRLWRVVTVVLGIVLGGCGGSKGPQPVKLVDFKPTAKATVAWQFNVGDAGRYVFTPALYGDSVFVASNRGDLVRLNAANGKVTWRIDTKSVLSGGVGIGENMVLVGTSKGSVLAFDLAGRPLWHSRVSSEVLSAPQASDEYVVVRSGDSRIFGLDARDGSRRWEYQTTPPALTLRANPGVVIVEGFVIAGMPAGKLLVRILPTGDWPGKPWSQRQKATMNLSASPILRARRW